MSEDKKLKDLVHIKCDEEGRLYIFSVENNQTSKKEFLVNCLTDCLKIVALSEFKPGKPTVIPGSIFHDFIRRKK